MKGLKVTVTHIYSELGKCSFPPVRLANLLIYKALARVQQRVLHQ